MTDHNEIGSARTQGKADDQAIYQSLLLEAEGEQKLQGSAAEFAAARLIMKAQAVALKHFLQLGYPIAAGAFPGGRGRQDGAAYDIRPIDFPSESMRDSLDGELYSFLTDRYPDYRRYWSEFLRDGMIAAAINWQGVGS